MDMDDIMKLIKVKHILKRARFDQNSRASRNSGEVFCYIDKERKTTDKLTRLEDVKIPEILIYDKIKSCTEARQKSVDSITYSQASRISGVSPSDVSVLLIYMGR
jgi:tRNA uridine 5-carboxymethylaminomethyl modification enzyme